MRKQCVPGVPPPPRTSGYEASIAPSLLYNIVKRASIVIYRRDRVWLYKFSLTNAADIANWLSASLVENLSS